MGSEVAAGHRLNMRQHWHKVARKANILEKRQQEGFVQMEYYLWSEASFPGMPGIKVEGKVERKAGRAL